MNIQDQIFIAANKDNIYRQIKVRIHSVKIYYCGQPFKESLYNLDNFYNHSKGVQM